MRVSSLSFADLLAVGESVGETVGDNVGESVGDTVGESVGDYEAIWWAYELMKEEMK